MTKAEFLQKRESIKSQMANLEGAEYETKLRELQALTADFQAETASLEREGMAVAVRHSEQNETLRTFLRERRLGSEFEMKREETPIVGMTMADNASIRKYTAGLFDKTFGDKVIYTEAGCPVQTGATGIADWLFAGGAGVTLKGELTPIGDGDKLELTDIPAVQNRLTAKVVVSKQSIENSDIDLLALVSQKINNAYAQAINFAACSTAKYGANFYGGFAADGKQTGNYPTTGFTLAKAMEMVGKVAAKNYDAEYGCFVMGPEDYYALKATPIDNGSGLMVIGADGKLAGFPVFVSNAINRTTFKGAATGHNIGFGLFNYLPCLQHGSVRLSIDGTSATAADVDAVIVTCNADWSMTDLYPDAFVLYTKQA